MFQLQERLAPWRTRASGNDLSFRLAVLFGQPQLIDATFRLFSAGIMPARREPYYSWNRHFLPKMQRQALRWQHACGRARWTSSSGKSISSDRATLCAARSKATTSLR